MFISSILFNHKGKRQPNIPKIKTLKDYTDLSNKEFFKLVKAKSERIGPMEMSKLIMEWQGFDNLTNKQKDRFVTEIVNPEYYSTINIIKRFINKLIGK